jgi:hypothetical protein
VLGQLTNKSTKTKEIIMKENLFEYTIVYTFKDARIKYFTTSYCKKESDAIIEFFTCVDAESIIDYAVVEVEKSC